ncbi:TPA: hypothetical protein I7108_003978 [Vibrio cholerae O1]|uniref:hypothetical protein n=3 Tax=Vibrio cholerae TaxID=666 RepID=UPI00034BAA70|nr:hypothetical protein [Vibrio cholerae]KQA23057.1 hypothetical protein AAY53_17910 [Vibrio metoecus]HAS2380084.1 hypothetical protein [Vibrio cholerae O1]EGR4107138.1 hypothetical protein [Vibrio cholerae]EGR4478247.1 hypothetical protein [Vibrio cholerae]ELY5212759.1 hypothetical protein [Vibrio cholerae]
MKIGYSILLGEYVSSTNLSYDDCRDFQIVCPECREPVFKVSRASVETTIDYLSHYKAVNDADCELRVSSLKLADIESYNSVSRKQTLEKFLNVFKSALEQDPLFSYESIDKKHKRFNQSKALLTLKEHHFNEANKNELSSYDNIKETADFYIKEFGGLDQFPKTVFGINTQIRIASDIMRSICTEYGRGNYYRLFNHAALYLLMKCNNPREDASNEEVRVLNTISYYVSGILLESDSKGMKLLSEMYHEVIYPPYVSQPSNYLIKVMSEIAHEMIGTLIRLPYFELLKR